MKPPAGPAAIKLTATWRPSLFDLIVFSLALQMSHGRCSGVLFRFSACGTSTGVFIYDELCAGSW
jgi:hypothetical protein